jgi:excisionase family DNA binding protein
MTPEGAVIVPPRIAHWLEKQAGVTRERRAAIRDTDYEAYEVLHALWLSADQFRTANGTKVAVTQPRTPELGLWLTAIEAAEDVGVGDSAIRKWIRAGRLPAVKRGGRWLVNARDLHTFRPQK